MRRLVAVVAVLTVAAAGVVAGLWWVHPGFGIAAVSAGVATIAATMLDVDE